MDDTAINDDDDDQPTSGAFGSGGVDDTTALVGAGAFATLFLCALSGCVVYQNRGGRPTSKPMPCANPIYAQEDYSAMEEYRASRQAAHSIGPCWRPPASRAVGAGAHRPRAR